MALKNSASQSSLGLGGNTPNPSYGQSQVVNKRLRNTLNKSSLDRPDAQLKKSPTPSNGLNPRPDDQLKNSLNKSSFDLNDGQTPTEYISNLPS